jgi:hypothetical protein
VAVLLVHSKEKNRRRWCRGKSLGRQGAYGCRRRSARGRGGAGGEEEQGRRRRARAGKTRRPGGARARAGEEREGAWALGDAGKQGGGDGGTVGHMPKGFRYPSMMRTPRHRRRAKSFWTQAAAWEAEPS